MIEQAGLALLRSFDPERSHKMALLALRSGFAPLHGAPVTSPRLRTKFAGLDLPNPVGLAAGFDKNAEAIGPLTRAGFGFLEVGAATPHPQPGNPKPRLFRLPQDKGVINRFGFNNDGMDVITRRMSAERWSIPVGLNLGANKDSEDRAGDYEQVLRRAGSAADFVTVNVSSPNTEKLRDLQGKAALASLLNRILTARSEANLTLPIFLKIAPDLTNAELDDIAEVAAEAKVDAIIATNTTLARDGLQSQHKTEAGGLSGAPLFEKSTRVLAELAQRTDIPLIGVGGISNAQDAYIKIKAGASAVQLYSAMVFQGISLAVKIANGLDELLTRDGHATLKDAVGIEKDMYT